MGKGMIRGFMSVGDIRTSVGESILYSDPRALKSDVPSEVVGSLTGAGIYGAIGAVKGGAQTTAGYIMGHAIGSALGYFT